MKFLNNSGITRRESPNWIFGTLNGPRVFDSMIAVLEDLDTTATFIDLAHPDLDADDLWLNDSTTAVLEIKMPVLMDRDKIMDIMRVLMEYGSDATFSIVRLGKTGRYAVRYRYS